MAKFLLTDDDLKVILNTSEDDILQMISEGMPHYYYGNKFYFNYPEVMDWVVEHIELSYIESSCISTANYLKAILKEDITLENMKAQLGKYIKKNKGLCDDKLIWLYNNCDGPKFDLFCQYIYTCFPGIKKKHIYKYYIALLESLLNTGMYKDRL